MIICVAGGGKIDKSSCMPECDIALFGFDGLGEVDYELELKGESDKFEELARLSKIKKTACVSGCNTISRGIKRKSAALSYDGKLLGIADMNHILDGERLKGGASLGLFSVAGFKVGICIENDLYFPDSFKSLSMCGANLILGIMENIVDSIPPLIMRTYAYLFGIPIVFCAGKTAYFADVSGEIATSVQDFTLFEITPKNSYRLVTTRQKGLCADVKADY